MDLEPFFPKASDYDDSAWRATMMAPMAHAFDVEMLRDRVEALPAASQEAYNVERQRYAVPTLSKPQFWTEGHVAIAEGILDGIEKSAGPIVSTGK